MKPLPMAFCLLAATAWSSELTEQVNSVSQAALQSAFQILRGEYIRGADLTFDEINRAAFQGLLQRLDLGAELLTSEEAARTKPASGVVAHRLTPEIGYVRPLALTEDEGPALAEALKGFQKAQLAHLILDLRSPAPPGEFTAAAAMLEWFIPRGELMFKLKQVDRDDASLFISQSEPLWQKPVVILVDGDTNNQGETLAAVLRHRGQALLIGGKTRGATVRYEVQPLDARWALRFARAEMCLTDDTTLFRRGLEPDFSVPLSAEIKRRLFASPVTLQALQSSIADRSRPRYNEAALLARKNPELDSYIRRSAGQPLLDERPTRSDSVLQRAVDMLQSRDHLNSATLPWPKQSRPATTPKTSP